MLHSNKQIRQNYKVFPALKWTSS